MLRAVQDFQFEEGDQIVTPIGSNPPRRTARGQTRGFETKLDLDIQRVIVVGKVVSYGSKVQVLSKMENILVVSPNTNNVYYQAVELEPEKKISETWTLGSIAPEVMNDDMLIQLVKETRGTLDDCAFARYISHLRENFRNIEGTGLARIVHRALSRFTVPRTAKTKRAVQKQLGVIHEEDYFD